MLAHTGETQQQLEQAKRLIARSVHINPSDAHLTRLLAHVTYRLALISQQAHHFAAALSVSRSCVETATTAEEKEYFLLMASDCYRAQGAFELALARAKEANSTSASMLRQVARTMLSMGRLEQSLVLYKKALKTPSASPALQASLWEETAFVYTKLTPPLWSAAELCYQQAIQLGSSSATLRLVCALAQQGKLAAAGRLLHAFKDKLSPTVEAFAFFLRALLAARSSSPNAKQIQKALEKVVSLDPSYQPWLPLFQ